MTVPQQKRDWESQFMVRSQPPGQTEQERCERAVRAIRNAIAKSSDLNGRSVRTFPQGSYANRTNVRKDSDVDVCVLYSDTFFYDLPPGVAMQTAGIVPAGYTYGRYKDDVGSALVAQFGPPPNVTRGNKAFDIHENTYRVDSDAVACFEYRLYYNDSNGQLRYCTGTTLLADNDGRLVTNFPQQQYDNGVAKNNATGKRFKALVRIIKNLKNEMESAGEPCAEPITSFLIESLVWNWPTPNFNNIGTLTGTVEAFLVWVHSGTKDDAGCAMWLEENGIKQLFGPQNAWTRQQVREFAFGAFGYVYNQ